MLPHVQNGWLSHVPTLQCPVTIKDTVEKLLLEDMPKNDKNISKNDKYLSFEGFRVLRGRCRNSVHH